MHCQQLGMSPHSSSGWSLLSASLLGDSPPPPLPADLSEISPLASGVAAKHLLRSQETPRHIPVARRLPYAPCLLLLKVLDSVMALFAAPGGYRVLTPGRP